MKVTAFIADDERVARAGLREMLRAFEWVEVVGEAADGESAVHGIRALQPELVFLDVQMPGMLGTDVLRHIEHRPFVMFTTAYDEHAVAAFELGAVDYLLKPFGRRASPRRWIGCARRSASRCPPTPSSGCVARSLAGPSRACSFASAVPSSRWP
jgi:DNA-binding LytR/AlgR family response regulator